MEWVATWFWRAIQSAETRRKEQSVRFISKVAATALLASGTGLGTVGCLDVDARAPDIYLDGGPPPERVNSSQVPPTSSHEEAQAELQKAYHQIRYLEDENRRLKKKVEDEKARGDEYKDKYNKLKDRYEKD